MCRAVDKTTGATIHLGNARCEAMCLECGKWHTFDPFALAAEDPEFNFADCEVYCDACWEKHEESGYYD